MNHKTSTITLTFGDMAENHVGMEQLGEMVKPGEGFTVAELVAINTALTTKGLTCHLHHLNTTEEHPEAALLVVKNFVDYLLKDKAESKETMFREQAALNVDKKAFMYGRVVDKHARWNLCFDDVAQEPDYKQGKGRIVAFSEVPIT